jgi:2-polyprenyl-3-methyl-5-hydroxy-6-metoxy-1,4-benzoquinol methylase
MHAGSVTAEWASPYEVLRRKWGTIPCGQTRIESRDLLRLGDRELLEAWNRAYHGISTGPYYGISGWYHDLYRPQLFGRKVLDLGCGMAVSSIHFAEHGARVVFADIVEDNVRVVERLCALKGIAGEFLYIEDQQSLAQLPHDFDAVLAIGSLINAPTEVIREEVQALLPHLKTGCRWLHFAYPKTRWVREGMPRFSQWGEMTDGPGTPWMEYHEWETLVHLFAPTPIELVFGCEWHDHDFNWFDFRVDPDGSAI